MGDLEQLFDKLSDGICVSDAEGRILYMNPAAKRMVGAEETPPAGGVLCDQLCGRLYGSGSEDCAASCPLRVADNDDQAVTFKGRFGPQTVFEWRDFHISRREAWRNLRVRCQRLRTAIPDSQESEKHFTIIEDATAEMDLQKHIEDWRSMMAHDLRLPLTSVHAALQVLREIPAGQGLTSKEGELMAISVRSCQRMMELLDLYLDVAKLDSGAMPVKAAAVRVADLARKAAAEQAALAASRRIAVTVDVPAEAAVRADEDLLFRVVGNLLNNALKFTPEGGRVEIRWTSRSPGSAALSVKDSGPGIDPQDLPFIFDRFYQAKARREGRIRGNGLGLTFCREALKAMGGAIEVATVPGAGSEFTLTLPPTEEP